MTSGPAKAPALLRATLVHLGVLPPRHDALDSIQPCLERLLTEAPAHHQRTLRVYAEWSLLHRARRRAATPAGFTPAGAANIRGALRTVAAFLTHLDDQGPTLATLTQAEIDCWLEEHTYRAPLKNFITWAHRHRLTGNHQIDRPPHDEPHRWWDTSDHWTHLRRCLHHDDLPLDVRAAGAIMLLYGTSITRIVELTTTDLADGDPPTLRLGLHQAPIPPAAHLVLRRQADQARPDSAVGRATHSSGWIFPGQAAGTHRSAATFTARLRKHGLPARTGRNTALLALAEDLPASVLSDTLGISITAALQWTRRAARDWNAYVATRT
jgi:hypothetical protein